MQKFSSNNAKDYSKFTTKEMALRNAIWQLMNDFLQIRIEGPINPILMGTIFISGKEHFTEALCDFITTECIKENRSILELAKNKIYESDMTWVESKIDFLSNKIAESNSSYLTLENLLIKAEIKSIRLNSDLTDSEKEEKMNALTEHIQDRKLITFLFV